MLQHLCNMFQYVRIAIMQYIKYYLQKFSEEPFLPNSTYRSFGQLLNESQDQLLAT